MRDLKPLLERYGQAVRVCYGDGRPAAAAQAFIQLVTERREDWREELPTPLGILRRERFLYIGAPEVSVEGLGEGYLCWGNKKFCVQSARAVYIGDKCNHWWALLTPRDEG